MNLVTSCIETMRGSSAFLHPFLAHLLSSEMDPAGAERFAVQWYKAATAHKRAFPGLIYNTPDDQIRIQLIEILREEYGYGDAERVHARILEKFIRGLGVKLDFVADQKALPQVQYFAEKVDEAWTRGDPIVAFGVHFALEYLAANMHAAFYKGVRSLSLTDTDIEYFKIHSIAEEDHAKIAEAGFCLLGSEPSNVDRLREGVALGTALVERLLDGLQDAYQSSVH